jgi:hypothetical protein
MRKTKQKNTRSFAGIPRVVMECPDYVALGPNAIRLLVEMACQYKGRNNGDLCPSYTLMKPRGFKSKATLTKAIRELVAADLLMLTRQGGRNNTASLYAITWEAIDDLPNKRLEVSATRKAPRSFELERQGGWKESSKRVVQKLGLSSPIIRPILNKTGLSDTKNWARMPDIRH